MRNFVAMVETRVHEAILSAMKNLVAPRMELAMKYVGISLEPNPGCVVLDPDQRGFSGDTNGLQMTATSRFNSDANLDGINETRGNITTDEGDLMVEEKIPDRETHAHHINVC